MARRITTTILFVSLLFLIGCKKDPPSSPETPKDVIIPSTTKVLTATDYQGNLVSSDSTSITFRQGNASIDNLRPNDILVSSAGVGVLRKVVSVRREGGNVILTTAAAALTDAIQKGSAELTKTLTINDTAGSIRTAPGVHVLRSTRQPNGFFVRLDGVIYDDDRNPQTTNDQVVANGSLDITPGFTFSLQIDNWQLQSLNFSTTTTEDLNFSVQMPLLNISSQHEIEVFSVPFHPIVFFIGFVPVVITPNLSVSVGIDGSIHASMQSSITQHAEYTGGLRFNSGQWTRYRTESHTFGFQPPTLTAGANVKAYTEPALELLLYGVVGPKANGSLYAELDADLTRTPWLVLYGGIDVTVGVELEILSHVIVGYEATVLDLRAELYQSSNLPGGTLRGSVRNAATNLPLAGVTVEVFRNTTLVSSGASVSDGTYQLNVPAGTNYRVVFSKQGFLSVEYQGVNIQVGETTILETVLQIDQAYSGQGSISGTIRDALTGSGVSGVTVRLRAGINVQSGPVVATTSTNASGVYAFSNLSAGNYTGEASHTGYNTSFFSVLCLGGQTVANQDATISPQLNAGEIRIVLTWGSTPRDLDSHLTGPLPGGGRFHMYYVYVGSANPWPTIVNLDRDDVDGFGPETTTLYQQISGTYRFSVHDYTNRNLTNSVALSNSGAQVRVYNSTGLLRAFNVPPNTGGTLWTVFELNGSNINPIGTMTYVSNPGDITRPFASDVDKAYPRFPDKSIK
jgi:hypothetical protein